MINTPPRSKMTPVTLRGAPSSSSSEESAWYFRDGGNGGGNDSSDDDQWDSLGSSFSVILFIFLLNDGF